MKNKVYFPIKFLLPITIAFLLILVMLMVGWPFLSTSTALNETANNESATTYQPTEPYPTIPPDASKISVDEPDEDGYATVTGAAGTVPADAEVVVINVSAHTVMTDTADTNGAFTTDLYAPPGSSLLIKYETGADNAIERFWQDAVTGVAGGTVENINPLPGTMIYVSPPPPGDGATQAFNGVGNWWTESPKGWAGWAITGTLQAPPNDPPGLAAQPGETVTITARFIGTSPAINCTGTPTYSVNANISLRYIFDENGRSEPWNIWFNSYLFTPTGMPIEHEASGESKHMTTVPITSFTCDSSHSFSGDLISTITIPLDLPTGIFRPEIELTGNVPLGTGTPQAIVWYHTGEIANLPLLRVGDPEQPRIPWTLLGDYPLNGHRGLQARGR